MRYEVVARSLVLLTWAVDGAALAADLPGGLRPALDDGGRGLVSIVAFRNQAPRLGGLRGARFAQVNVRTYVERDREQGIFLYLTRVGLPGLAGAAFGLPVRPARIRVAEGRVSAPGLGVELRYRHGGLPQVPQAGGTPLGSHDVAFLVSAGLRRLVTQHEGFAWQAAELLGPPRVDPVLALGFDVHEPDSVLYAERTALVTELPPEEVG